MDDETKHNEMELRAEWFKEAKEQTLETLPAFLKRLSEFDHEYGTIPRALAAAALGAAWALDKTPKGGITGFQAGFVMWDFIQGWGAVDDGPLKLIQYNKMLFPQFERHFKKTITTETWKDLQKKAREHLENPSMAAVRVRGHWRSIVDGEVPFGYTVEDDD